MRHLAPYLRDRFDYGIAGVFLVLHSALAVFAGVVTGTLIARDSLLWLLTAAIAIHSILSAVAFFQRRADYREERA